MTPAIKNSAFKNRHLLAFLFFVLLSILAIGANPFDKETTGPFDLLVSYPGYSSVASSHLDVRCQRRSDILDARFPGLRENKLEFHSYLKNFNEKKLDMAEKLYGMIWKPSLFVYMIIPNDPVAYYFSQLIKLIIAGFGTYLFLKLFLSYPASLFGGMVYMLCGFNAAWFFWAQVETSLWIPWLFWAVALYLIHEKKRYLFLITLASVFLINGGYPGVAALGFYAAALLIFIYNIFNPKNIGYFLKKSFLPLLFMAFGFMISSHYLLNLVDLIQRADLSYRKVGGAVLNIKEIGDLYTYNPHFSKEFGLGRSVYIGFLASFFTLLSFLYFWVKKKTKNWKSFYIFSLLLLIISIVIRYGLIDKNIIRRIPVFSFNDWFIINALLGLSLALLSSFFIEFIDQFKYKLKKLFKVVVPVLIILIFVVQFGDQKRYFNQFNGPTPSRYFFPLTPSIEFVKKNIKDCQSIIADYSFNISGTLSSYGFFEWFRHTFRSREEKELLLSLATPPRSSPTSFTLSVRDLDLSSPLMNLFAVKYIFVYKENVNFTKAPYFLKHFSLDQVPSPPLPFNRLSQHFYNEESRDLAAVNLFLGTYRDENFDSNVLLKLYDSQNKLIGVSKKNKKHIQDNTWVYFDFEEPVKLRRGEHQFSLELENKKTRSRLSAWSAQKKEEIPSYLTVNGEKTGLSFQYFLHEANEIYTQNYKIHRLEPALAVVENSACPDGPYLISDINEYPPTVKADNLKYESSVGEMRIHLPKGSSGYVVIPRPLPHHRAYVDGKKKPMEKFLDVMPAVYVEENSQVQVKEKRFYPLAGYLISFFSLLSLLFLFFFFRKKKNF